MRGIMALILLVGLTVAGVGCSASPPVEVVNVQVKHRMFDSLDHMITYSTLVVTGEVLSVLPSRPVMDDGPIPMTEAIFKVDQVLKGQVNTPTIKIYQLGGRVADKEFRLEGVRYYDKGEQLVLFLEYAFDDLYTVTSAIQGEHRMDGSRKVKFIGKAAEEATLPQLKERSRQVPDRSPKAPKS